MWSNKYDFLCALLTQLGRLDAFYRMTYLNFCFTNWDVSKHL